MAFCGSCGAQVQDGIKFCQTCGQAMAVAVAPPVYAQPIQAQPPVQTQAAAQYAQPLQQPQYTQQAQASPMQQQPPPAQYQQGQVYQPPVVPGAPQQADIRDAQDNKTMAILAYILFFVPLLTGAHKTSPFAKFHTNQGTILFLASAALGIVFGILSAIITGILTSSIATWGAALTIGSIFGLIWMALAIVIALFAIVGIVNAAGGKMKPLPLIGRITIIK